MGVSGLWTLLEPVGKRVNIKSLAGKTLAIDASIWVYQFFNSMRDDDGNFIKNGHLLGFFRRICRLLFNRIRPVFVFDGATPALKRMTTAARRRRREQQAAKVTKTAHKLLMAKFKSHLLTEEKARRAAEKALKKQETDAARAKKQPGRKRKREAQGVGAAGRDAAADTQNQPSSNDNAPVPPASRNSDGASTSHAALATLAAQEAYEVENLSAAAELLEDDVAVEGASTGPQDAHEPLDSEHGSEHSSEPESEESAGEIDLDAMVGEGGELDPTALSQLPTSLQIELMGKYRERQTMLNRSRFQQTSSDAQAFSGLQMATYLKQTELRRKVDKLKDNAASTGAERMPAQPDSLFVLKDHAKGNAQINVPRQIKTLGRNTAEWNRRVMNEAKHRPQGAAPTLPLHTSAVDLPAMQTIGFKMASEAATAAADAAAAKAVKAALQAAAPDCVGSPRDPGGSMHAAQPSADATTQPSAEPAAHTITAEDLALAMDADTPSTSGSGGDDCEWEDALELSPEGTVGAASGERQAAQPSRRDMWTRTHGYKFGRKLEGWSDGREEALAVLTSDAVDAAALDAVAAAAEEGQAGDSVQEARKLQRVILQSLEEQGQPAAGRESATEREALVQPAPRVKRVRFRIDEPDGPRSSRTVVEATSEQQPVAGSDVVELVDTADVQPTTCAAAEHNSDAEDVNGYAATPVDRSVNTRRVGAAGALVDGGSEERGCGREAAVGPEGCFKRVSAAPVTSDRARVEPRSTIRLPSLKGPQRPGQVSGCASAQGTAGAEEQPGAKLSRQGATAEIEMVDRQDEKQAGGADAAVEGDLEFDWEEDDAAQVEEAERFEEEEIAAEGQMVTDAVAAESAEESPSKRQCMQDRGGSSSPLAWSAPAAKALQPTAGHSAALDVGASDGHTSATKAATEGRSGRGDLVGREAVGGTEKGSHMVSGLDRVAGSTENAADRKELAYDSSMESAHAAALEQEQAEEDILHDEEDEVVVRVMHSDSEPGTTAARRSAEDAETSDVQGEEQRVARTTTPQVEGAAVVATLDGPELGATSGDSSGRLNDGVDLEKRISEVMGDVSNLKRKFKKQSGSEEVPTEIMYREVQELLQLFGISYIVAPMEAEAQCAWLNHEGLVDGVVTDDNDVFLFGATHVYRHFFQDQMYCEQYLADSLAQELGLKRERLALLALLLGSDYTEGISGIGIVNAMETIATYPSLSELKLFRQWLESPDIEAFRAVTKAAQKRKRGGTNEEETEASEPMTALDKYKAAHRSACKSWDMPPNFPEKKVLDAYANPHVDSSKSSFTFQKPDIAILRGYCLRQFQWSQDQADTLLQPVLKQYEEKETQLRLDAFWTVTHRFAKIRSKRLQAAISTSLGRDLPQEMVIASEDNAQKEAPKDKGKVKAGAKARATAASQQPKHTRQRPATAQHDQQNQGQVLDAADSSEEEQEDEFPADVPRYDLPVGDAEDDEGLEMDPYRAQFFY